MEFEEGARADGGQVDDRRNGGGGGGGGRGKVVAGGGGLIGLVIAVLYALLGGGDGSGLGIDSPGLDRTTDTSIAGSVNGQACSAGTGANGKADVFATCAFNDIQATWTDIFQGSGKRYTESKLVLYRDSTSTACGEGQAAEGPFYCPPDQEVYLDLSFFDEMRTQLGAGGDFAQAYVVAHEVGHHVQNLLGTADEVAAATRKKPSRENDLSVRTELQADCFAGVWANVAQANRTITLDSGDVNEAVSSAASIGDDRLARAAGQRVDPDSFTHGTSAQRKKWLQKGLKSGDPGDCDTFSGSI